MCKTVNIVKHTQKTMLLNMNMIKMASFDCVVYLFSWMFSATVNIYDCDTVTVSKAKIIV